MTAIIAVTHGGKCLIGSDRAYSDDSGHVDVCGPKVLRLGSFAVGVAGSLGGCWEDLVHRAEPRSVDDVLELLGPGPDAQAVIARGRYLYRAQWESTRWGACRVYRLTTLGTGAPWAEGAFMALKGTPIRERLIRALEIAAKCCNTVRGPFDLLET